MRGGGKGAGLGAGAGAACDGAAVIGPDGACANVAPVAATPSATNPANTASLKEQMVFMFDLEFGRLRLYYFPPLQKKFPQ